ncbi:MAG: response regulator [Roseicyclus sp.]|jgi:CheY-like chemotaxis protein
MVDILNIEDFRRRRVTVDDVKLQRILHVDDDADIRAIVQMSLELVGNFEISQCHSGEQALAVAKDFRPDLLLLDFMMPEMTGQELAARLAAECDIGSVPVIFVTAKAEESFSNDLVAAGALAVITKPFDPMTLASEIEKIWQSAPRVSAV